MTLLSSLLLPGARATGPNLLTNGDFTLGDAGWTEWGGTTPTCTHEVSRVHDALGEYHLADASALASCGIYQAVPVQPGVTYRGVVWVDVHSGTVQLYVRWVDANGNDVSPTFPVDTSVGTGGQVLAAQGAAPSGATHARFWVYCTTASTCDVHADDAELTVV